MTAIAIFLTGPGVAQDVETLFDEMHNAEAARIPYLADKIRVQWSKSGSAAMDLLLSRGRDAVDAQAYQPAIGHFTALIDHAPGFTQAYFERAQAYFAAGLVGPAVADLRVVLQSEPRHFDALGLLAVIHEQVDQPQAAMRLWDEVERLLPGDEMAIQAREALILSLEGQEI